MVVFGGVRWRKKM
jgi:hypothetical protein